MTENEPVLKRLAQIFDRNECAQICTNLSMLPLKWFTILILQNYA